MYPFSISEDSATAGHCVVVICVGKHPLETDQNIEDLLRPLSAKHHDVLVLICDDPCKHDQMIPRSMTIPVAEKMVKECGDQTIAQINRVIKDWKFDNPKSNITVIRWAEIIDEDYTELLNIVVRFRGRFEDLIRGSAGEYIHRRVPTARLTERRLDYFAQHLIDCLPLYIFGAKYGGNRYSHAYHPIFTPSGNDHDPAASYRSPVMDVVSAYCNDAEFMEKARRVTLDSPLIQWNRVFFEKPVV
ncbi:hypothetical protein N7491_009828 [Penicillium cf. griseofulvum]|uniref:Uncharacterized protein n=1 Tax=Penicillium cf. griseofulvum TaxID=2972120 RepID=A0A9W9MZ49_9EURO|nr:hypothetical protein N7472_000154 [Penicillium cf. griseofulvum]KAJ5421383.1 hypothetical protein N7491_009828 [Penicillium cf. griseofulvum]KAJ5424615.1 hypothetical protein N7445_010588 [Penicillium cf. griseofulvum]